MFPQQPGFPGFGATAQQQFGPNQFLPQPPAQQGFTGFQPPPQAISAAPAANPFGAPQGALQAAQPATGLPDFGLAGSALPSGPRTPEIPLGNSILETTRAEWVASANMIVLHYKVLQSDQPNVQQGFECAFKRSMNPLPQNQGGREAVFKYLNAAFLPLLGLDTSDPDLASKISAVNPQTGRAYVGEFLTEMLTNQTIGGAPFAGRKVLCFGAPGKPDAKGVVHTQTSFRPYKG